MQRRQFIHRLTGAAALAASLPTWAQATWPDKPVRLLVGFAPGGPADGLARIVSQELGETLRQPFVVDNRAGAGGTIAANAVAKAPADGYTLLMVSSGHAGNATYYNNLPYDTRRDFAPVAGVAASPVVIVVNANSPYRRIEELLAAVRAQPGKLNYATGGGATLTNLAAEVLKSDARLDAVSVPYKGSGPALAALLGGEIDFLFDTVSSAIGQIRSGRMRALAVTSSGRSSVLPDVPTLAQSGLPGFDVNGWFGVLAPAQTPPAVLAALNREVNKALARPEVLQRLSVLGADPLKGSEADFGRLIASETDRWEKVIKRLNLRSDT
ncbi:MAG: tripartite tricarboxylate transporter substrate binding protein [Burkholderiaceae bacterium]|nr:tripartite tricarboxylate transporter substrate binding protein [Burkholderiaceae bacterium]